MIVGGNKYNVKVIDAFLTESSKGTVGICWTFACDDGRIECTRWVTENTADRVKKDMETLGFPPQFFDDVASLERVKEFTLGHECEITTKDEVYNGVSTTKVEWINKLGSRKAAGAGVRDRLAALLAGKAAPLVSAPRPAAPAPSSLPIIDDDIPF